MALKNIQQHKTALNTKILELLMVLKDDYGMSFRDVADKLKVTEGTISKVKNQHQAGSEQMLAALEMLLELTKIKREQEDAELQKKLADGTLTVAEKVKLLKKKGKL